MRGQVALHRPDKQLPHKQAVPGKIIDDPNRQAIRSVRAGVEVLHEQFISAAQIINYAVVERVKLLRFKWLIDATPVDQLFGGVVADGEFVFRRSPGMLPGVANQGAIAGQPCFAAANGVLDQRALAQITMHALAADQIYDFAGFELGGHEG